MTWGRITPLPSKSRVAKYPSNCRVKSVFVVEGRKVIPTFPTKVRPDQILREIEINRETVKKELERLNEHKAPGPDGIPNIVLRRCAEELAVPLERLFNRTMVEGKIPNEWKQARIASIYNKGARCEPGNYRPVSLDITSL